LKTTNIVTSINLTLNQIGNEGAISIFKALKINASVRVLSLVGNDVDRTVVRSIDNALHVNKQLGWSLIHPYLLELCIVFCAVSSDTLRHAGDCGLVADTNSHRWHRFQRVVHASSISHQQDPFVGAISGSAQPIVVGQKMRFEGTRAWRDERSSYNPGNQSDLTLS